MFSFVFHSRSLIFPGQEPCSESLKNPAQAKQASLRNLTPPTETL